MSGVSFSHGNGFFSEKDYRTFEVKIRGIVKEKNHPLFMLFNETKIFPPDVAKILAPQLMTIMIDENNFFDNFEIENTKDLIYGMLDAWASQENFEILR